MTVNLTSVEEGLHDWLRMMPSIPTVAWPNRSFDPDNLNQYLKPRFFPNSGDFVSVGINSPVRQMGIYQVSIYDSIDTGNISSPMADLIMNYFINELIVYGGVRIRIGAIDGGPGVPYRIASFVDGTWNVTPVTIPWWCDQ